MDKNQETLLERAKILAGKKDVENEFSGEIISVVEFLLIPEIYAVESKFVAEVLSLNDITPIPCTPPFVMGVINLRGKIISVINLKQLFNLKQRGLTELNKVIVLKNDDLEFGILADAIIGNNTIQINSLCAPPVTLDVNGAEYIAGISSEGLILLNTMNILTSKQIIINQ